MKFYTKTHKFYCGIDLHAKTMYLCILNPVAVESVSDHRHCHSHCLEHELSLIAKTHDADSYFCIRSIPGIGRILGLVILYEIHDKKHGKAKSMAILAHKSIVHSPVTIS